MIRTFIKFLCVIVLVVAGLAGFAVGTSSGAAMLVQITARLIPGELSAEDLEGSLLAGLHAGQVHYRLEQTSVQLNDVHLVLDLFELMSRRITIESLTINSAALGDTAIDIEAQADAVIMLAPAFPFEAALVWSQRNGSAHGEGRVYGDLARIDFSQIILLPDQILIDGRINSVLDAPRIAVAAEWVELNFPESGAGSLVSREGRVTVEGALEDYRLEAVTDLFRDDTLMAHVIVRAHGAPAALELDALQLSGPAGDAEAQGQIKFGESPIFTLAVSGEGFNPAVVQPGLDGRLDFAADLDVRWPVQALVNVHRLEGEFLGKPVSGQGEVRMIDGLLEVATARLRSGDNQLRLSVNGGQALAGQFEIDAPDLASVWPGLVGQLGAKGQVAGTVDDYRLQATADLSRDGERVARLSARAHGNPNALELDTLQLSDLAGGGEMNATGRIEFGDPPVIRLAVSGERFNPAVILPELDGQLGFAADLDARWPAHAVVNVHRLDGEFQNAPVRGEGEFRMADGVLELAVAQLRSGDNRLQLSASGGSTLTAELEIDAPDLASLWPGLGGQLRGRGQVAGTYEAPEVSIDLTGAQIEYAGIRVEEFQIVAVTDAEERIDWGIQVGGIETNGQLAGNLNVRVTGRVDDHVLQLNLTDGPVAVALSAAGAWDGSALRERVNTGSVDTVIGSWTLREPVSTVVSAESNTDSAHCWDSVTAEVCVGDIAVDGDRWQVSVDLARFPLETLNPWLGGELTLSGEANATLKAGRSVDTLIAEVDWAQTDTRIQFVETGPASADEPVSSMYLSSVAVQLVADERQATLSGRITGDFGLALELDARVAEPLTDSGVVSGWLRAVIPDIGELGPLLDRYIQTSELAGVLDVDVSLAGTRAAPEFAGTAGLYDASAVVSDLGIAVEDIVLSLTADGAGALDITGAAVSGEGSVVLSGTVDWSAESGIFSEVGISGQNFELLRLPDQSMAISPAINARLDNDLVTLSGRVLVPTAAFRLQSLGSTAVSVSDDVIVHGVEESESGASSRVVGEVDIELGDAVTFEGLGVTTHLRGGLGISQADDGTPLRGEGSLQLVDGRYTAFGTEMIIERGSLNFLGPLDDPVLDVRAVRLIRVDRNDIKVGIALTGPLSQQLDFVLFSDPGMSEADILSYLVVGRPSAASEPVDSDAVSSAAIAMGLTSLARGMGSSLPLDDISFEGGNNSSATSVVAGKRLTEDLYVRYTYGLFNRVGTFIVRYDIGRGVSVEAGSGAEQSLDLIYSIDR